MNVGIIGYGTVGKAYESIMNDNINIYIRDIKYENTYTLEEIVRQCNIIFICVSTPNRDSGIFDTSNVNEVIYPIEQNSKKLDKRPFVVVKSTVVPLLTKRYVEELENIRLVISPENLTENNAEEDLKNSTFQILGGYEEDTSKVERFFKRNTVLNKNTEFKHLGHIEAAFLKYIRNSLLATKVSLLNEFFEVFEELPTQNSWEELMEALHLDKRMGTSHYQVPGPDGKFGWGGKCFPKDIEAITNMASQISKRLRILEKVREINSKHREIISIE